MSTLYASFANPADAERAAGALLDHGAIAEDISVLANEKTAKGRPVVQTSDSLNTEHSAKSGLSTTTPGDVAAGAGKGAAIGLGVGALAVAASLFIPGVGLVIGGGALAAALMGGVGTAVAGAAAGGVAGLLADQGIPEDVVTSYSNTFVEGGAILEIAVPSGKIEAGDAEALLTKYNAANIATVNSSRVLTDGVQNATPDPLVVQDANPDIAPVMYAAPVEQPSVMTPTTPVVTRVVRTVPQTTVTEEVIPVTPVVPTTETVVSRVTTTTPVTTVVDEIVTTGYEPALTTDPLAAAADPLAVLLPGNEVTVTPVTPKVTVTDEFDTATTVAEPFVDVVDPVSGNVYRRPVETVMPNVPVDAQMTTLTPNTEVVADRATGALHQTVGNPTVVSETPVVVTDPKTGLRKAAKIVEEQHAVVRDAASVDADGHAVLPIEGASETVIVREKHIELL